MTAARKKKLEKTRENLRKFLNGLGMGKQEPEIFYAVGKFSKKSLKHISTHRGIYCNTQSLVAKKLKKCLTNEPKLRN
ncbi:hypothetical protein POVCU2_0034990 [Plasmodium ovale curtisi]|uniref:Uncharacterized protein n=1 Tax=Plasmodium ovale curtisi TaxID=864141 RepID=A0A1A8W4I0_PLAOA|nr:hypothetical protein POVCU2_0034990 [Plasmodium ovale curtisi]